MSNLKEQLIKLGYEQPELRDDLRPVLSELDKQSASPADEIKKSVQSLINRKEEAGFVISEIKEQVQKLEEELGLNEYVSRMCAVVQAKGTRIRQKYEYVSNNPDDMRSKAAIVEDCKEALRSINDIKREIKQLSRGELKNRDYVTRVVNEMSELQFQISQIKQEMENRGY